MVYPKCFLQWLKVYGAVAVFLCMILGVGIPAVVANDNNEATEAISGSCESTTRIVTAQLHRTQNVSETYQGPCGSGAQDSRGHRICCGQQSRAICTSDGRCFCRTDNYCTGVCQQSRSCDNFQHGNCSEQRSPW